MLRMPDEWNPYALASGASFNNGSCSIRPFEERCGDGHHRCWQLKSSTKLNRRSGSGGNLTGLFSEYPKGPLKKSDATSPSSGAMSYRVTWITCFAPQNAAPGPPCLEQHTLGVRHRELAGYLPLTAPGVTAGRATIQQNLQCLPRT